MLIAGVGYEGRDLESVVAALEAAQVELVIDVRLVPWSRKKGLSKTRLSERLAASGISYLHMKEAGNPKEIRRSSKTPDECLERYSRHIGQHPPFVKKIYELAEGRLAALLCFESGQDRCHRSVIFERLSERYGKLEIVEL